MKNKFENQEPSITESTDEEIFQKYVEDLRLSPADFGKKILDIGAGSAQFAKWAREHGVNSQIYSIDQEAYTDEKNTVTGKAEALPFADESFELVISDAAVPHGYIGEGIPEEIEKKVLLSLKEAIRVLKRGGEIRFARVLMGELYENQKILTESILKALNELKKEGFEVVQEHIPSDDTYEYEGHEKKSLLAKAYLITIRKNQFPT